MRLKIYKTFYIWATLLATLCPTLASVQPDPEASSGPVDLSALDWQNRLARLCYQDQPQLASKPCNASDVLFSNFVLRSTTLGKSRKNEGCKEHLSMLYQISVSNFILVAKVIESMGKLIENELEDQNEKKWVSKRRNSLYVYRTRTLELLKATYESRQVPDKKTQFITFADAQATACSPECFQGMGIALISKDLNDNKDYIMKMATLIKEAPVIYRDYLLKDESNRLVNLNKIYEKFMNFSGNIKMNDQIEILKSAIATQKQAIEAMLAQHPQTQLLGLGQTASNSVPVTPPPTTYPEELVLPEDEFGSARLYYPQSSREDPLTYEITNICFSLLEAQPQQDAYSPPLPPSPEGNAGLAVEPKTPSQQPETPTMQRHIFNLPGATTHQTAEEPWERQVRPRTEEEDSSTSTNPQRKLDSIITFLFPKR